MYEIAIIGAGINGSCLAYELSKTSKNIVIFDMTSIAGGGSGAAGAFISPKFSSSGELKELINKAYIYSTDFYLKKFPNLVEKTKLIHFSKCKKTAKDLKAYKKNMNENYINPTMTMTKNLKIDDSESISINSCIVNANEICKELCKNTMFIKEKIISIKFIDGLWVLNNKHLVKKIVLSTGAYKPLLQEPYLRLRGTWGHRIDIKTTSKNIYSLHKEVSISPLKNGIVSIGATHNTSYHPELSNVDYDFNLGREELLSKASSLIDLKDIEIVKDYTGLRSTSYDYIPLLGRVVNSKITINNKSIKFKTKKPDFNLYDYYPNLYIFNGSGSYGFVLAPYLANILKNHILYNEKISEKLSIARLFARWARKLEVPLD